MKILITEEMAKEGLEELAELKRRRNETCF